MVCMRILSTSLPLWFNSTGSLACEMNHFVQNKSQTTKALEHWIKKGQLEK